MNTVIRALLSFCFFFTIFAGCGDQSGSGETHFIRYVGIEDATTLIVAESRLYKNTDDGMFQEVSYSDENGQELEIEGAPDQIENINEQFVLLIFSGGYHVKGTRFGSEDIAVEAVAEALLVNKQNGAVFSLGRGHEFVPLSPEGVGWPSIQVDGNNQLYYLAGQSTRVVRVNTSDPESLFRETLTPESDFVQKFAVTSDGTLIYLAETLANARVTRLLRPANALLENLPEVTEFWRGTQDIFVETNDSTIDKLVDNQGVITFDRYAEQPLPFVDLVGISRLLFADHVIFVGQGTIFEVENPQKTVETINLSLTKINLARQSQNSYYLSGLDGSQDSTIVRITPGMLGETPLLNPGDFDVGHFDVSFDDIVTFDALRISDLSRVIGEISADGELRFPDEQPFDTNVTVLERIR